MFRFYGMIKSTCLTRHCLHCLAGHDNNKEMLYSDLDRENCFFSIRHATMQRDVRKRAMYSISIMRYYNTLLSFSRDSVLRSGSCIGIRDTWKCGYFKMHHTELRRRICVGRIVGRKRRFDLQTVY